MSVLETERLALRRIAIEDAPFILELVNEPAWLQFIGDKGVHCIEDACNYIRSGPMASYVENGFGLWLVEAHEGRVPLGICGLIRRDGLPDVDIGFAFLERHRRRGFAVEAATAVMAYGKSELGLERIVAITDPENHASIRVLEKLGLRFERTLRISADDVELSLFGP